MFDNYRAIFMDARVPSDGVLVFVFVYLKGKLIFE